MQVPVVRVFHDYAENGLTVAELRDEAVLVADDVHVAAGADDLDLVHRLLALL